MQVPPALCHEERPRLRAPAALAACTVRPARAARCHGMDASSGRVCVTAPAPASACPRARRPRGRAPRPARRPSSSCVTCWTRVHITAPAHRTDWHAPGKSGKQYAGSGRTWTRSSAGNKLGTSPPFSRLFRSSMHASSLICRQRAPHVSQSVPALLKHERPQIKDAMQRPRKHRAQAAVGTQDIFACRAAHLGIAEEEHAAAAVGARAAQHALQVLAPVRARVALQHLHLPRARPFTRASEARS